MNVKFFYARDMDEITRNAVQSMNESPVNYAERENVSKFIGERIITDVTRAYPNYGAACANEINSVPNDYGLKLDFNFGLRLDVPPGKYHVKISDSYTGGIFFDADISATRLMSFEKYYIRWKVEVSTKSKVIFSHKMELAEKNVLLAFQNVELDELMALIPYVKDFQEHYNCRVSVFLSEKYRQLFALFYPDIPQEAEISYRHYATFYPMFSFSDVLFLPFECRTEPMERIGGAILGLSRQPKKLKFNPIVSRPIAEPYVCIATNTSKKNRAWLYPNGWSAVINYLRQLGYRVVGVDENFLVESANFLHYAEFFIGLSDGLAWLADAVNCPVVMIGGFTQNWFEFYTRYRIANRLLCSGCFNDPRVIFRNQSCPYYADTPRELECQKKISPRQVINTIERLIIEKNLKVPALS